MIIYIAQNASLAGQLSLSSYLNNLVRYIVQSENIDYVRLFLRKGSTVPSWIKNERKKIYIHEIHSDTYTLKGNISYIFHLNRELTKICSEEKPDIIHCVYPFSSVLGSYRCRSNRTKIVYDVRSPWIEVSLEKGYVPGYAASLYRMAAYSIEKNIGRIIDYYLFISKGLANFYKKKNIIKQEERYSIIPDGYDPEIFTRKNPRIIREKYELEDSFVIGYVGVLSRERGLDKVLISLKKLLKSSKKDYRLLLVGDGELTKYLKTLALNLGLKDKVIFTGKVTYEDVPKYISAFDVGISHLPNSPAYRYSVPLKVLEYLACGVPVLASDIVAHREIARRVKGVFLYKTWKDFEELLLNDEMLSFAKVGDGLEAYSWKNLARRLIALYEKLVLEENENF